MNYRIRLLLIDDDINASHRNDDILPKFEKFWISWNSLKTICIHQKSYLVGEQVLKLSLLIDRDFNASHRNYDILKFLKCLWLCLNIFWTLLKWCHVDLITSQIYFNPNFDQFRAVFTKNDLVLNLVFGGYEYFRIVTIISHNDPPITVIMVFNLESFIIKLVDHPLLETWYNHLTKSLSISFLTDFAINQSETTLLNFKISTISIVSDQF